MTNYWTGDEIRRHAESIAAKVDAGEATATMGLDRHGFDFNVWSLVVRETEKGAQLRKARQLADELDAEMGPVTDAELEELRKEWPR